MIRFAAYSCYNILVVENISGFKSFSANSLLYPAEY